MDQTFTLYQFNKLTNPEKYALIEDYGSYLEVSRIEGKYQVALFELYGFYVEVWLNQSTDKLLKATGFKSYKKLDQYLHEIDITEVFAML